MIRYIYAIIVIVLLHTACKPSYPNPHVLIETSAGDIELEVYPDKAPKTAGAFLQYVDSGFYTNTSFYRILNDDNQPSNAPKTNLIQGGLWRTKYKKAATIPGVTHETTQQTGLRHTSGTISLARTTPGSAAAEFFICIGDQPGLDFGGENNADGQGYAAFGRVVKGMNIVNNIYRRPEEDQYFRPPVAIYGIKRL